MVASIPGGHSLGIMKEAGMRRNAMKAKTMPLRMTAITTSLIPVSRFQRFTHTISMASVGVQSTAMHTCHLFNRQPFEATLYIMVPTHAKTMPIAGIQKVTKNLVKFGPPGNWYELSIIQ
mmetsp:Transcript_108222/g.220969  ORF Transcript_108222/g.220969 Transcript_108222/m.220969 type:complete len:120 (-) Transcript_108222:1259-1618(-)